MKYKLVIKGVTTPWEDKEIQQRVKTTLQHHPAIQRGESLTFRFNKARVFLIPEKEEKPLKESA